MFRQQDFTELVSSEAKPAVSLYLPTHMAGREIRQDPIRFKNLLDEAENRLAAGARKAAIARLLAPARRLVSDEAFWRHQGKALAVFLAPDFARVLTLPAGVPEHVSVDDHFCVRPLLPLAEDPGHFWLLAISARRTRLYLGSRWGLDEIRDAGLPSDVDLVARESEYEETHYGPAHGRRRALGHAQPLGDAPDEVRKAELLELLRRIAAAAEPIIKRRPLPIVLAAAPEIDGNFRMIAGWTGLLPQAKIENPDALDEAALHRHALSIAMPAAGSLRKDAIARFASAAKSGDARAATLPQQVTEAARYGRVDTLLLGPESEIWGRFDDAAQRALVHARRQEEDSDLLNFAVLMTLRQGGRVVLCDPDELPAPFGAAAILRY